MRSTLLRLRDRSALLLTLNYLRGQALYRAKVRRHLSGATHLADSVEDAVEYIERVFADYLSHGNLSPSDLTGKRVLEVGPGDSLGVALLFAAHGAQTVVCIDAFAPARDEAKAHKIYERLRDNLRARRATGVDADVPEDRIRLYSNTPIEKAAETLAGARFDLIVSRAVLEHVSDVAGAWRTMDALLVEGGLQLHKVDFRNHGFYDSLHPLYFLRVPQSLWRLISQPDPTLNRARSATYEALARGTGYQVEISVTHVAGRESELPARTVRWPPAKGWAEAEEVMIEAIRPKLSEPFKSMSLAELLVAGVFMVGRKPQR